MLCHILQHVGSFKEGKSSVLSLGGDIALMLTVVAQRFLYLYYATLLSHKHIEEPVATETHVLISVALRGTELVAAEDALADIGDGVTYGQLFADEVIALVDVYAIAMRRLP